MERKRLKGEQRENMILRAAFLYCEGTDRTVSSIASELKIKRSTAVRLLKEAVEKNYVIPQSPKYNPPPLAILENEIRRVFRLKDAVVTPNPGRPEWVRKTLASASAHYIEQALRSETSRKLKIGIGGGPTLHAVVQALPELTKSRAELFPLHVLGRTLAPDYSSANMLVPALAKKFHTENFYVGVQEVIRPGTEAAWFEELEAVKQLRGSKEIQKAWSSLDMALMSVAPIDPESWTVKALSKIGNIRAQFKKSGAVAILNLAFISEKGETVQDFFISIPVETLRDLAKDHSRYVILIAGGKSNEGGAEKDDSIRAVLKGGLANILVTDDETATRLLVHARQNEI